MTSLIYSHFIPRRKLHLTAPFTFSTHDVSIVIPVRNNQSGIDRFLSEFFRTHPTTHYPREIIIVDNHSETPIQIRESLQGQGLPISLLTCHNIGPASARNMGIKHAQGEWILFTDSDCVPTASFLTGYQAALNGSVGYAGNVHAFGKTWLADYYESQRILVPPPVTDATGIMRPHYLITANTFIWKPALELIDGFDETIHIAAGEDIDLGFRLSEIGDLSYAPESWIEHDFGQGLAEFIWRFKRYGTGNYLVGVKHEVNLVPRPFEPARRTGMNWFLSGIQYLSLVWGYYSRQGA